MADFQPGDVVRLKSSDQKMTVIEIMGKACHCTYFDKDNNLKKEFFEAVVLEKVDKVYGKASGAKSGSK